MYMFLLLYSDDFLFGTGIILRTVPARASVSLGTNSGLESTLAAESHGANHFRRDVSLFHN